MNMLKVLPSVVCALLAVQLPSVVGLAAEAEPVKTTSPSGSYQTAWLQLERGAVRFDGSSKARFDASLFLGLRDGRAVVAWFVHPALSGSRIVWLDSASLQRDGAKLEGRLVGRTNLNWGDKNVHDYEYTIDARIDERQHVAGTFRAQFVDDSAVELQFDGVVRGRILTSQDAAADQIPAGNNWPHYYGDGHAFTGPASRAQLVDDLSRSRPVWKSEAFVPTSYGSAPDSRYFDRAGRTGFGGGASSPLIVENRVYQFYYTPRGPVGLDKPYGKYETEADLQTLAKGLFPKREVQQRAVVDHFRTQADEVLICLDAATGRTLWQTTFPQRGNNYQTHKHRGHFPVALIAEGVVYQPGTAGRLYAVDAVSGQLRWEFPDAKPEPYVTKSGGIDCQAPSPVRLEGVVAFASGGRVTGVHAETGVKRWERPVWHRGSLLPWHGGGRNLLLASDRDHQTKTNFCVALDPASGDIVWKREVPWLMDYGFPLLAGDLLLAYSLKLDNVKPGENDGLAVIHAARVTSAGLHPAWTTPPLAPTIDTIGLAADREHVYVSAARETFCLRLQTGERVAAVENVGGARTQTAFLAAGRLFIQPEGRHGRQSFFMLNADPRRFSVMGAATDGIGAGHPVGALHQWMPPHAWTSAYANQPIVYPLVDGRLFIRGLDAIYCYDLRAGL